MRKDIVTINNCKKIFNLILAVLIITSIFLPLASGDLTSDRDGRDTKTEETASITLVEVTAEVNSEPVKEETTPVIEPEPQSEPEIVSSSESVDDSSVSSDGTSSISENDEVIVEEEKSSGDVNIEIDSASNNYPSLVSSDMSTISNDNSDLSTVDTFENSFGEGMEDILSDIKTSSDNNFITTIDKSNYDQISEGISNLYITNPILNKLINAFQQDGTILHINGGIPYGNAILYGDTYLFDNYQNGMEFEQEETYTVPPKVGILWWMRGDQTLANTRDDTRGFANYLQSKGWQKKFDINEDDFTESVLERSGDQDNFEQADFVYYAGHGYEDAIIVDNTPSSPYFWDYSYYHECEWGDEGPVKWVGLASCFNTQNKFKVAMNGINLLLGWSTWCDDKPFGETLAKHAIDDEMSIKQAWFATAIEKSTTKNLVAKVMGENTAAGNDRMYPGGNYIEDIDVDNIITYWECPVNWFPELSSSNQQASMSNSQIESTSYPNSAPTQQTSSTTTQSQQINTATTTTTGLRAIVTGTQTVHTTIQSQPSGSQQPDSGGGSSSISYNPNYAFPTYLNSAPNNLPTENECKNLAINYMINNGLLSEEDELEETYAVNVVPQKQGFSYKKTIVGTVHPAEHFEEWTIAYNVFIIKQAEGLTIGGIVTDDDDDDDGNSNSATGQTSTTQQSSNTLLTGTTGLRASQGMESSEILTISSLNSGSSHSGLYQKTTLVVSNGGFVSHIDTRIEQYDTDEWDTSGNEEP